MITIISPAKSLNFDHPAPTEQFSQPRLLGQTRKLARILRTFSQADLQDLMRISPAIAELNRTRFKTFKTPFDLENAKQALFAFQGDVYRHMRMNTYDGKTLDFAQNHLRILSGFYGILLPLDLIQPYRLEMKTPLKTDGGEDLYQFWGDRLTRLLAKDLRAQASQVLINLASKEYARAIDFKVLKAEVITIEFKEVEHGKAKVIAIFAKWARGMMADHILQNHISDPQELTRFNRADYVFSQGDSDRGNWVFTRPRPT